MNTTGTLSILHADDDDSFRLLVDRVITRDPHMSSRCRVHFEEDGCDAVDYVMGRGGYADRRAFPLPHLILLDQRMTTMDGIEALRLIKEHEVGRRIPVFIFSTSAQHTLVDACYGLGASFCIRKPLDFEMLGPMLRLIVDFAWDVLELPLSRRA